jgi:hypothetical protein
MTAFVSLLEEIDRKVRGSGVKEIELSPESKLAGQKIVRQILKRERELKDCSIEQQGLIFALLYDLAHDKEIGGTVSVARQVLIVWSDKTKNRFGEVYRLGWNDGHIAGSFFTIKRLKKAGEKKILYRVSKAAGARRTLGDSVREQIARLVPEYVGFTKGEAAYQIAPRIGKQPDTVRKYLSEMYPRGTLT